MDDELKIMLKSYDYLREEILTSIRWQNRLAIAETTVISILFGLGLNVTNLKFLIMAIPPAVIVLSAFWLIEQSRMIRAGDYLQFLEDEINAKSGGVHISWENWLRMGTAGIVHTIHHWAQYLGVLVIFHTLSGISLWMLWKDEAEYNFPMWAWWICVAFLIFLLVIVIFAIQHRPTEKDKFKEWKRKYWNKINNQPNGKS